MNLDQQHTIVQKTYTYVHTYLYLIRGHKNYLLMYVRTLYVRCTCVYNVNRLLVYYVMIMNLHF